MLNKQTLQKIQKHAVETDWVKSFGGKSKGSMHLFRVNKIAVSLATSTPADLSIVQAGAWLHDIGLVKGNDDDPNKIRELALAYLATLDIPQKEKDAIADCVASHEGMQDAASLEAQIVHDADVIDKQGMLGIIRHTWKLSNLIMPDSSREEVTKEVIEHIAWRESKLYLKNAKEIASTLNKDLPLLLKDLPSLEKLIGEMMKDAKAGVISDDIASKIKNKLPSELRDLLESQLACKYLSALNKTESQ